MCNLSDGIERKGRIEGITETASAFTSFMISELGFSKEEAEAKAKEVISSLDKDSSLFM